MDRQAHVIVSGRVQGVGFRAATVRQAKRLGLTGWVRNLRDGSVEALFRGPAGKVEEALEWCRTGPAGARVDRIEVDWEEIGQELEGFEIRR